MSDTDQRWVCLECCEVCEVDDFGDCAECGREPIATTSADGAGVLTAVGIHMQDLRMLWTEAIDEIASLRAEVDRLRGGR